MNRYSPYHDDDSGLTSMGLDEKGSWVHVTKARTLEQERDEARTEVKRLIELIQNVISCCDNCHEYKGRIKECQSCQWLREGLEQPQNVLPCPFHSDGKHRCVGCGDIP